MRTQIISHVSTESIKALNRRVRWEERGVMFQHDQRHVDVVEDIVSELQTLCRRQQRTKHRVTIRNHWS